jgi:O-antigen ligase/tetratricopeptide (TPR) repeat protein
MTSRGKPFALAAPGNWQSFLLALVDLGLASVVFVAPLFLGGRHPIGELAYVVTVCFTALAWTLRQGLASPGRWQWSWGELFLPACLSLLVMQLVPWPADWLDRLSPSIAETLPLWSAHGDTSRLDEWRTLSLFPEATRGALVLFLAHALLFLVVVQRLQRREDLERVLRWLALAAILMAALGLVQFLFGNGKFLWVYQHPYRDTTRVVKGTFSNENHFAHFLILGIGPLVWWLQRSLLPTSGRSEHVDTRKSPRSPFFTHRWPDSGKACAKLALTIGLGLVLFAGLLTFSRGGVLVMVLALVVCGGLLAWKSLLGGKEVAALAATAVLTGSALMVFGSGPLARELASLGAGSLDQVDHGASRRKLWTANLEAAAHFPLLGTGGVTHAEVCPIYFAHERGVEYTHAENGYLQILLEYGIPGVVLLGVAIIGGGLWLIAALRRAQDPRIIACTAAVMAGLVASLIHALWDFVWYLPACMSLTVILMACACRLRQFAAWGKKPPTSSLPPAPVPARLAWCTAALVTLVLSILMINDRLKPALAAPHWDRYLHQCNAVIADPELARRRDTNQTMIGYVEKVLDCHSRHARAHLNLAELSLQRFELEQQASVNPMPLAQVRDAVSAAPFASRAERDAWLTLALGANRAFLDQALDHTRRALRLCPLQGQGYLYLAELSFLVDDVALRKEDCIAQALRVRPHQAAILVAAGNTAALAGDLDKAVTFWKRAFHQDREQQRRLIEMLSQAVPASFFLEKFEPDLSGLETLLAHYRKHGRDEEAHLVAQAFLRQLEEQATGQTGDTAARLWTQAHETYRFLGNQSQALASLRKAVDCVPHEYNLRHRFAAELVQNEQYEEAVNQFRLCLYHRPQDLGLKAEFTEARRQSLQAIVP